MSQFHPVRFVDVRLEGTFWKERLDTVVSTTIASQHHKLEEYGILDSIKLPKPVPPPRFPQDSNGFTVQLFWDSDVGKWIESASYALSHRRDADIEAKIEAIIDDFERAQAPDGYLNCWYLEREPEERWSNLRDNHELYNAGHMIEGAVAYFETTGRRRWLGIMERYVDHIAETFGTGPGQRRGYCGHPEIELALVKLYHLTKNKKHLDLAAYFVNERGNQHPHYYDVEADRRRARGVGAQVYAHSEYSYCQAHMPVREQDKVVGHAVRAIYLYTAMADLAVELKDDRLRQACETLWNDVMVTKMYVTGGLGPSARNEGFTFDYDLPNQTAYAETCASVALIFWAQRMLHFELDGKYADVLERALYNGALSGLSRDGKHYFYANPLESNGSQYATLDSNGSIERWDWHTCPCCTMNVSRLVSSVGGYFVSVAPTGLAFHLYGGISTTQEIAGTKVNIREVSTYPWSGEIKISIDPAAPTEFDVKLRIPGWAQSSTLTLNGAPMSVEPVNGYVTIRRTWGQGDVVGLDLPMPPQRLYAHPGVVMDAGRVALRRGPLVYCLEEVDNPGGKVQRLKLPRNSELMATTRADLFDGAVTLSAKGTAIDPADWQEDLYRTAAPTELPATLTAVPYYLWANRGLGSMVVWIPEN